MVGLQKESDKLLDKSIQIVRTDAFPRFRQQPLQQVRVGAPGVLGANALKRRRQADGL